MGHNTPKCRTTEFTTPCERPMRQSPIHFPQATLIGLLSLSLAGCNWLIPGAILMGPPTKKVEAEFSRLSGHKVLVLVWASPKILSRYPYARYDIAKYVSDALRSQIKDVRSVSVDRVEEELRSRPRETAEPGELARQFGADMVVYLELLRYRMRMPESPHLFRGDISGSVVVYDLTDARDDPIRYDLSSASALYPEGAPVSVYNTTEQRLRKETSEVFGKKVAMKFKPHRVEL